MISEMYDEMTPQHQYYTLKLKAIMFNHPNKYNCYCSNPSPEMINTICKALCGNLLQINETDNAFKNNC